MITSPTVRSLAILVLIILLTPFSALAQSSTAPKLPWTIAFMRSQKIWLMDGDGTNHRACKELDNIIGKPSWAPDGKRLAFTRRGSFTYQLPDGGGGTHRLYDVFATHIDSTRPEFWWWITLDHGSRGPDWSPDGKYILYTPDLNANQVDAELPDYRAEYRTFDGSEVVQVTRPGAGPGECMGLEPTWSPDGERIAMVYHILNAPTGQSGRGALQSVGLVVVPASGIVRSEAELKAAAEKVPFVTGPAWSPDGKWIAYVDTKTNDGGIHIVTPDGESKKRIFERTDRIIPYPGPVSWSPDSKWILFASTSGYIFLLDTTGENPPYRMTSNGNDYWPAFAPK